MKTIAAILVAMFVMAGFAGAVTFEKPHVAKNLTAPSVTKLDVKIIGEDSETVYIPEKQLVIGIDANKFYGGISEASADQDWYTYMVHYNNGYWEGLFPQDWFWGGEIEHHLGFTSNIPWEGSVNDWQNLPAFQAWADNRELAAHGFHVVDGHIYDAQGREYVYLQGAPTNGAEIGENPVSNPGLPETGDQTISYTVGDLTDQ